MLLQHLLAWLPHMAPYGLAAGEMFGLLTTLAQMPHPKAKRSGDGDKPPRRGTGCALAVDTVDWGSRRTLSFGLGA